MIKENEMQFPMKKAALSMMFVFGLLTAGISLAGDACYWMQNSPGYPWVPAPQGQVNKQDCFNLDSCDGGKGYSGGGCYKWAASNNAPRQPWFSCFWMKNVPGNPWVPAPQGNVDQAGCFALDSCNGGKGQSGGGCYKWALDSNAPAQPWQ